MKPIRYKGYIIPSILVIALAISGFWGFGQYKYKNDYKLLLNNQYQRMFFDMKDHVETVQVSLSKVLVSESRVQNSLLLSQIWQQSLYAQEKLSQIPVKREQLGKTQKFLNQVGDFCHAMVKNQLEDRPLTSEQRNTLNELQGHTEVLTEELAGVYENIMKGNLTFGTIQGEGDRKLKEADKQMPDMQLVNFEEEMAEYPELIYDGPFSDETLNAKPKGLGTKQVGKDEAVEIAKDFIVDKNVTNITMFPEGEQNDESASIPAYTFSIATDNKDELETYIGVSKTGGKIIWMENPRKVKENKLSVDQARKYAEKFLKEKGYEGMEPNYSLKYDGIALFNFAYKEEDVTIYTDLIKVEVALDTGEILAFDASAYLRSHHERDIPQPKLTEREARDRVRLDFDIQNIRLTIIPKNGRTETLCYEFKGKYNGENFIVYINALTGQQEQILRVLKDENGILMI